MDKSKWFEKAVESIMNADEDSAVKVAEDALADGMDPLELINGGFSEGIRTMGDLFDKGQVFLPTLIIASEAMSKAVKILEDALPESETPKSMGKVVLGTIEGDVHDIGKGIVATMLRVYGFEVYDLGRDVPVAEFVNKAIEVDADFVGSSALMTTTQAGQKKIEEALTAAGIRDKVKTMVGGAVATEHWANKIGADIYAETASELVMKLKETVS